MSETIQPIHPLRQRMIEDMTLRGISPGTQKHYLRAVRACCVHLCIRPGDLTGELARSYLLHLQGTGVGYVTINGQSTALRFFLRKTLGRRDDVERVPVLRRPKSLPAILSPEEVARIIAAAQDSSTARR
jgi:site-specific recombinase XerD